MRNQIKTLLTFLACFGASIASAQVSLPNGTVEAPVVDLRVKVLGGVVTVDRQWWEGNWRLNLRWAAAELNGIASGEGGCYAYPQVKVQGRNYNGDGQTWLLENRYSVRATDHFAGADCLANRTKKLKWQDRMSGNWMEYERVDASTLQFRLARYGDKNDVTVSLVYDPDGKLKEVRDHFNTPVLKYTYTGNQLTQIEDVPTAADPSPARKVIYTWGTTTYKGQNVPVITAVKDVLGHTTQYGITNGQLDTITDPETRVRKYTYTADRVTQYTDGEGKITTYVYDYDKLKKEFYVRVTDPLGGKTETWYDPDGLLIRRDNNGQTTYKRGQIDTASRTETRLDTQGRSTTLTRDEYGNLTKLQYPDGSSTSAKYSAVHGQLLEETDERGIKTQYDYDAKGNLLKKTEAVGLPEQRITDYQTDPYGQITQITRKGRTEANGTVTPDATIQYAYDNDGTIVLVTDAEGGQYRYTYQRSGQIAQVTDPRDKVTRYDLDAKGRRLRQIDPLGNTHEYAYDKVGNLKRVTDPRGKIADLVFDKANRPTQVTNPLGGQHIVRYDALGLPIQETDEDGRQVDYQYDPLLRLQQVTDGLGNRTEYSYALPQGEGGMSYLPQQITYPTYTEQLRYNQRDWLVQNTLLNPNAQGIEGLVTSGEYDAGGYLKSATDAHGKTSRYSWNALGEITEDIDSLGNKTQLSFDTRGNLIQLTDAKGNQTRFEYDRTNRLTAEILPMGQTSRYQYDAAGNLSQYTDPLGNQRQYTWDDANRLTRVQYKNAAQQLVRTTDYEYNAAGHLTQWTDTDLTRPAGQQVATATLNYDDANRKTGESISYPGPQGSSTWSHAYGYSLGGDKTRLTWADGTEIGFTYAAHGELDSITIPGEGNISVNQFKWVAPAKITLPGGTTQEMQYDGLLNLESLKVKNAGQLLTLNLTNTYGKIEELKTSVRTDTAAGSSNTVTTNHSYDDEGQLLVSEYDRGLFNSETENFTLDALGNRIAHSQVSGQWTYDANNRLTQRGSGGSATTYEYDANGNLIQKTEPGSVVTRYVYDTQNRLTELRNGQNDLIARYGYDPLDRRLWKEVYRQRNGTPLAQPYRDYFIYADEGLIGEARQAIAINAGEEVSAQGTPALRTQYAWLPDSPFSTEPLFTKTRNSNDQDTFAYFHLNQIGAPVQATDKAGNVVWVASYNSFGQASIQTPEATVDQPTITTQLRLPGQYLDEESGLHYNYRRYYAPDTGRYLTEDPIGLAGGLNRYAYAEADPVNLIDPTGEAVFLVPAAVAGYAKLYGTCVLQCMLETGVIDAITGECFDLTDATTDCALGCVVPFVGKYIGKALNWGVRKLKSRFAKAEGFCEINKAPANSFPADTLVHVKTAGNSAEDAAQGKTTLKPISQIAVGDEVLAFAEWKEKGGEAGRDARLTYEKVLDVYGSHKLQKLVHLTLDTGETVSATAGHPFLTGEGWRDAILLKKGGQLLLKGEEADGTRRATIVEVRVEEKVLPVFNLEVANAHTFFVGVDGRLVHNGKGCGDGRSNVTNSAPKYARNKYKPVTKTEKKRVLDENKTCVYCEKNPSTQVDHIRSQKQDWVEGGYNDSRDVRSARVNDPSNLTGSCESCNPSKGSKPVGTGSGQWTPPKDR